MWCVWQIFLSKANAQHSAGKIKATRRGGWTANRTSAEQREIHRQSRWLLFLRPLPETIAKHDVVRAALSLVDWRS
jgi:hypothetical protein